MHSISLPTYDVLVQHGSIARVGDIARTATRAHRYAVITDSNVVRTHAERVVQSLGSVGTRTFTVPAGEASKTREAGAPLTDEKMRPLSQSAAESSVTWRVSLPRRSCVASRTSRFRHP